MFQTEDHIIKEIIWGKDCDHILHFVSQYIVLCLDRKVYEKMKKINPNSIVDYEEMSLVPRSLIWNIKKKLALYFTNYTLYGMLLWIAKRKKLITRDEYKELCEKEGYEDRNNRLMVKAACEMSFSDKRRWRLKDYI